MQERVHGCMESKEVEATKGSEVGREMFGEIWACILGLKVDSGKT